MIEQSLLKQISSPDPNMYVDGVHARKLQAACYLGPAFEFAFLNFLNFYSLFVHSCFFTVTL